jgi:Protein of unknown function (DUF2490)
MAMQDTAVHMFTVQKARRIDAPRAVLRFFAAVVIGQVLWAPARAQNSDTANQFWPEFDVYLKLNQKSRLFFMYTATKQENLDTYSDGQTGIHFDFYSGRALRKHIIQYADPSRSKSMMFRVGYLFSRPKNGSGAATEHMAIVEATTRAHLPHSFLLSDRSRADFRWVDGNPKQRYRNRLKLENTFDAGRFQLTPYAHAEIYYDLNGRYWNRFRYSAGAEWNITKRIVLEGYYLRENTWRSVPQFVNAAGTAVQFYLR